MCVCSVAVNAYCVLSVALGPRVPEDFVFLVCSGTLFRGIKWIHFFKTRKITDFVGSC